MRALWLLLCAIVGALVGYALVTLTGSIIGGIAIALTILFLLIYQPGPWNWPMG